MNVESRGRTYRNSENKNARFPSVPQTPDCSDKPSACQREQEVNYFGDFSGLSAPISGHRVPSVLIFETRLQNVRAKNAPIYRDLLARPKRFELLTPRFVV